MTRRRESASPKRVERRVAVDNASMDTIRNWLHSQVASRNREKVLRKAVVQPVDEVQCEPIMMPTCSYMSSI